MLSKRELNDLQTYMPNFREQLTSKHLKNMTFIESQFNASGRNTFEKKVYISYVQLLEAIPELLAQGFVIDTVKSTQAKRNTLYPLVLALNNEQVTKALEEALNLEDIKFEKKIEQLQAEWINTELKEMITVEENKQIQEIKDQSKKKKKALLSQLLTSI